MTSAYRDGPGGLVSLWDLMNQFNVSVVVWLNERLQAMEAGCADLRAEQGGGVYFSVKDFAELKVLLEQSAIDLGANKLPRTVEVIKDSLRHLHEQDASRHVPAIEVHLRNVRSTLLKELKENQYLMLLPEMRSDFSQPLARFGVAADKFGNAAEAMAAASRCYALEEWDASAFHSMRVLEHGLRWLASQFPNLTLKKPVELENWENIINNIQARIDDELRPPKQGAPPRPQKTPERDAELTFHAKAAAEFRYFKDAWRNHVMHNRNDPYDEGTAWSVLVHVSSFMKILAERV